MTWSTPSVHLQTDPCARASAPAGQPLTLTFRGVWPGEDPPLRAALYPRQPGGALPQPGPGDQTQFQAQVVLSSSNVLRYSASGWTLEATFALPAGKKGPFQLLVGNFGARGGAFVPVATATGPDGLFELT